MRVFRYLGVALLCIVLVIVGLVIAVRYVDIDSYKDFIAGRIESATGREVDIRGEMSLDATLSPVVVVNDVSLSNVASSDEPLMIEVERLEASVNLIPLLRGVFEVNSVDVRGARVVLEKDADGKPNWQFREKKSEGSSLMPQLDVRSVAVNDIEIVWAPGTERKVVSRIDKGRFKMATVDSEVRLDVEGDVNNIPVTVRGQLEGLWGMITGRAGQVDLQITADGESESGKIALKGDVPAPGSDGLVDLELVVDNFDPAVVSAFAPIELSQLGPVSGTARLAGPLENPDLENLDLLTHSSDLKARVNGRLREIFSGRELDVVVDVPNAMPARLLPGFAQRIPAGAVFVGSSHVSGKWPSYRADSVGASLKVDSTMIELNGTVEDLVNVAGVDLGLKLDSDSLATLGKFAGKVLPSFGPVTGTGRLKGSKDAFRLDDLFVDVSDSKFSALIRGDVENVSGPNGVNIDVQIDTTELESIAAMIDRPEIGPGRVVLSAKVADEKSKWIARDVVGRVVTSGVELDVTGTVTDLVAAREMALGFTVSVSNLSELDRFTGQSLPSVRDIKVTGALTGSNADLGIKLDEITVDDPRLTVRGKGQIDKVLGQREVDIEFEVSAAEAGDLGEIANAEIPRVGPVTAEGRILNEGDVYRIEGFDARLTSQELKAHAVGSIADLVAMDGFDLEVDLNAATISSLPVELGFVPGEYGPLVFKSHVTGGLKTLRLVEFNADLQGSGVQFDATGNLANVWNPENLSVRVNVAADSLKSLSAIAGRKLPDVGPLNLDANIQGAAGRWTVQDLQSTMTDDRFLLALSGAVEDLTSLAGIKLNVDLDAKSAKDVAALFDLPLELEQRLILKGEVRQSGETIHVSGLHATLGDSGVSGELELTGFNRENESSKVPKIKGRLESNNIDLKTMFPEPDKTEKDQESKKDPDARVFSTAPLPLAWIKTFDADLNLDVERFRSNSIAAREISTRLMISGGRLRLNPVDAQLYGGIARLRLEVDAEQSPALVDLEFEASGIDPGAVGVLRDDSPIESGIADINLQLTGSGASLAGILSSSKGEVLLDIKDLQLSNTTLETIGADVTLNILRTINPLLKKENNLNLGCAIVQGDIDDGRLTIENTLATQSKRVAVVGSGVLDFKTEQLEFAVTPRPRKGLGLGAANFAQVVKIGGRLASPKVEADPAGFLKSGAKIGAALYTGGLSVLAEGLFNRLQATDNVCDAVRRTVKARIVGPASTPEQTTKEDVIKN